MSNSSDGSTLNTDVSADPSKFMKGMEDAVKSALNASSEIDSQFKKVGDTFDSVKGKLMAFTAVLAGGGALKTFISDANSWNGEAGKMAKQLGISTEKASVLNVALARLGISSDVYTSAADKLSKQITNNGQAFEVMGVKVKDSAGNYRPVTDVMTEVNAKIGDISNTVLRDEAGRQAYGKSWAEIKSILKLNDEAMRQAEIRARQLGLIVGPEGAEMSKQYSRQMNDLNLVGKSLEVQFGNALLPVFVKTGQWLSKEGPQAGQVFAKVLEGVIFTAQSMWLALTDMGDGIGALAAQAAALMNGDLEGAKAIGRMRDQESEKNKAKYEEMKALFGQPLPALKVEDDGDKNKTKHKPDPNWKFKKEKDDGDEKSRTGEWEAGLAAKKDAMQKEAAEEGQFREMSKQEEADYWKAILNRADLTVSEKIQIQRKYYAAEAEVRKNAFEGEIEGLNAQREALGKNYGARVEIAQQAYNKIVAAYGNESKEAKKAYSEILKEKKSLADQIAKIDSDHAAAVAKVHQIEVDAAQKAAVAELDLVGASDAQKIALERKFLDEAYQLEVQDMQRRMINTATDAEAYAKLQDQKLEADAKYQAQKAALDSKASAASMQPLNGVMQSTQQSFAQALNGMMQRTESFKQGMQSVWKSVGSSVTQELANMTAAMALNLAKQAIFGKTQVMQQAYQAAAGAYKAMVGIPYVGPVIAPIAAAATFVAVEAFGAQIPSASKGFDIPTGVNPLTQLHEREMVLPAKHADTIRNLGDGGGMNGGYHVHYHDETGMSSREAIRQNAAYMAEELNRLTRNGWKPRK